MMNIPDNLDIYESIERDMLKMPNPVMECDWCGEPIFEGQDYLLIEKWDKCLCEECLKEKTALRWWDMEDNEWLTAAYTN